MIIDLPWLGRNMPSATVDVIRGCNARCTFCYKRSDPYRKTVGEVEAEIDALLARRRLQALMVSGGEPLLHPDILAIIRTVRSKGLVPILFTNGILLDAHMAAELREAGCGPCFLHIQEGQIRDDLHDPSSEIECVALLGKKCDILVKAGLRAGCCLTTQADDPDGIRKAVERVLAIPALANVLFTVGRNVEDFDSPEVPDMPVDTFLARFKAVGLVPFAALRGRLDPSRRRWFTFQVVEARDASGALKARISLHGSHGEAIAMRLQRLARGRYEFTLPPPSSAALRARLLLNALTGGGFLSSLRLAFMPSVRLTHRALVLDTPPYRMPDGRIETCASCPAAEMSDGELKPLCLVEIANRRKGAS